MKIFVLGKLGSVVHWVEDAIAGFRAGGHEVRFGVTRDPRLHPAIERLLISRRLGVIRASGIKRMVRRFSPDLILAVGAYGMPEAILEQVSCLPGRPPLLGWVGDRWSAAESRAADWLDAVAYTDSGMLALHHEQQLPSRAIYMPHAANPRLEFATGLPVTREPRMVFVANPTRHRRAVVGEIQSPLMLYGPGWTRDPGMPHEVHARRVGIMQLATIYRSHHAVLNIRNEGNVLAGLNQRHFDPCLAETPVVTDNQPDLTQCFEPDREVLVYRDAGELNEICVALRREPERAAAVGRAARRRVLAHHTYAHRLNTLAALAGLSA